MADARGAASPAVGIFGGTFDPVHLGHLRMAEEVAEQLALGQVLFVPAGDPNLRTAPVAPAEHRARMVALAIQGNPRFRLDERELRRPGKSYTVDTLLEIRHQIGAQVPLFLILGADAFGRVDGWHRWRELFELAHMVTVARPGSPEMGALPLSDALRAEWTGRGLPDRSAITASPAGRIVSLTTTGLDISATDIRRRLARGLSARYLLPGTVLEYIQGNRLYSGGGE